MTIDQAIALGLVPPIATKVGPGSACICVNMSTGHPVVCLQVDTWRFPDDKKQPPGHPPIKPPRKPPLDLCMSYDHRGGCDEGPTTDVWPKEQIINEIAGGFLGAVLDCFDQLDPEAQMQMLDAMGAVDKDDFIADIRGHVCAILEYLFIDACEETNRDQNDAIAWGNKLSEWCNIDLLNRMIAKLKRCQPPLPSPEPEGPPSPIPIPQTFIAWRHVWRGDGNHIRDGEIYAPALDGGPPFPAGQGWEWEPIPM